MSATFLELRSLDEDYIREEEKDATGAQAPVTAITVAEPHALDVLRPPVTLSRPETVISHR